MISAAIERCAGIDVGKKFLSVCVMVGPLKGEPQVEIRKFGTIRAELQALRDWLKQQEVTHVVMESTGTYWKSPYVFLSYPNCITGQHVLASPAPFRSATHRAG